MWPQVGQAVSRNSKYSWARALTSSGTAWPPVESAGVVTIQTSPIDVAGSAPSGENPAMPDRPVPLVDQLRFMRSELRRGVGDTSDADGARRVEPMNSIGWIVAHMAWQEQRQWLVRGQGLPPVRPELEEIAPNGGPASTPSLAAMLDAYASV